MRLIDPQPMSTLPESFRDGTRLHFEYILQQPWDSSPRPPSIGLFEFSDYEMLFRSGSGRTGEFLAWAYAASVADEHVRLLNPQPTDTLPESGEVWADVEYTFAASIESLRKVQRGDASAFRKPQSTSGIYIKVHAWSHEIV